MPEAESLVTPEPSNTAVEMQGMDLTIWRASTSTRLRPDGNGHDGNVNSGSTGGQNSPFSFAVQETGRFVRLFLSIFAFLSFVLAATPSDFPTVSKNTGGFDGRNVVPLDMTLNITVHGVLRWNDDHDALDVQSFTGTAINGSNQDFTDGSSHQSSKNAEGVSILAVPALFGKVIRRPIVASVLVLENIDGCHKFSVSLPSIKDPMTTQVSLDRDGAGILQPEDTVEALNNITTKNIDQNADSKVTISESDDASDLQLRNPIPWFALIPRGNCPFDLKVFNAEAAGFAGVMIFNNNTTPMSPPLQHHLGSNRSVDLPVRMSANTLSSIIKSSAMFITRFDSEKLISVGAPMFVTIIPDSWPKNGWGGLGGLGPSGIIGLLTDLLFLAIAVIIMGFGFTLCCLIIALLRNYWIHGRLFVIVFHSAPRDDNNDDSMAGRREDECFDKITLPLRIFTENDLSTDSDSSLTSTQLADGGTGVETPYIWRECCAICIDEFVVGSRVRKLPCKHQFHDACIDPWLLKHNRLCPICKRDVLAKPDSAKDVEELG